MNRVVPMGLALAVAVAANFTTPQSIAADATAFGIVKSQQYLQTNAAAPVALAVNGFAFNSFVIASTSGAVTNATVDPPGATPVRRLLPDASQLNLRFQEQFNTQAALDAAYPNGGLTGSYLMTLQTVNDGTQSATLNFTLFGFPLGSPPVLQVTSLAAAQSIDHTLDFTLRWSSTGGQVLDFVQLVVLDGSSNTVFTSPIPFTSGALTGSSNHFVIPSYSLPAGSALTAHLAIARPGLPNTNAYPGAIGIATSLRDTEFPMATRPAPAAPHLEILQATASPGPVTLRFSSEANRVYRLQASAAFSGWNDLLVTNPPAGVVEYADPESRLLRQRFYRVRVGQ